MGQHSSREKRHDSSRLTAFPKARSLVAILCLVGLCATLLWFGNREEKAPPLEAQSRPAPTTSAAPSAHAPRPEARVLRVAELADRVLESSQRVVIDAASLEHAGTLVLQLRVGDAPPAETSTLPARVIDPEGRVLPASAVLSDADRTLARLELPTAEFPTEGAYLVEVETAERSHFPLRRYVLELR